MENPLSSTPEKAFKLSDSQEIVMSYGLFADVMRILGDPESALDILINDASIRDFVIRRLFTPAQKPVQNLDELINPFEIDLDALKRSELIAWVADHVMHFIMSTAEKTRPVVEKYADRQLAFSNLSKNGSES